MTQKYVRLTGDKENPTLPITVEEGETEGTFIVTIGDERHEVEAFANEGRIVMKRNGRSLDLPVEDRGGKLLVQLARGRASHEIMDERLYKLQLALGGGPGALKPELLSPMAGKVVLVKCAVGDRVEAGQTILIIEAMKMENELRAEAPATIKAIHVGPNDVVEPGARLIEFSFDED